MYEKWKQTAEVLAAEHEVPNLDKEDVIQELIMAQWIASKQYDPKKGAETTYYSRVAHNKLINLIEKATAKKRTGIKVNIDDVQISVVQQPIQPLDIEKLLELAETRQQRKMARLIVQNGLTVAKVAKRLKIAENDVRCEMRKLYIAAKRAKII